MWMNKTLVLIKILEILLLDFYSDTYQRESRPLCVCLSACLSVCLSLPLYVCVCVCVSDF